MQKPHLRDHAFKPAGPEQRSEHCHWSPVRLRTNNRLFFLLMVMAEARSPQCYCLSLSCRCNCQTVRTQSAILEFPDAPHRVKLRRDRFYISQILHKFSFFFPSFRVHALEEITFSTVFVYVNNIAFRYRPFDCFILFSITIIEFLTFFIFI